MSGAFDLRVRRRTPEIMDQADLDAGLHEQALRGLERINRWSRSAQLLWPALRSCAPATGGRPLRVLDLATGAGDVPLRLWRLSRRAGVPLEIEGCDRSARAVAHARRRATEARAGVRFFEWDALAGPLPGPYDVTTCSLFLHHLDEEAAVRLLRHMAAAAGLMVLVHDLRRSRGGMLFAYLGSRLLSASPVVHHDAPASVAAAFTCAEVRELARRAGLEGAEVQKRWPYRFLLRWVRPLAAQVKADQEGSQPRLAFDEGKPCTSPSWA